MVASVVPELLPADVTIFDVTRGQAFTGETTDTSLETRQRQQTHEITRQYEQRLQKALSHIPNVGVVVQIDRERRRPTTRLRSALQTKNDHARVLNRPASLGDADAHLTGFRGTDDNQPDLSTTETESKSAQAEDLTQNIRVSVSIPRDYLRDVARRMQNTSASTEPLDLESIEQDVSAKVERIVAGLVPLDSARQTVSVTCVDRLTPDSPDETLRSTSRQLTSAIQKWRFALIFAGLSVLSGVWILKRNSGSASPLLQLPDLIEHESNSIASPSAQLATTTITTLKLDQFAMLRDEIRSLVESDPAASAALLGNWLSEANE